VVLEDKRDCFVGEVGIQGGIRNANGTVWIIHTFLPSYLLTIGTDGERTANQNRTPGSARGLFGKDESGLNGHNRYGKRTRGSPLSKSFVLRVTKMHPSESALANITASGSLNP